MTLLRTHATAETASDEVALTLDMLRLVKLCSADPRTRTHRGLNDARRRLAVRLRNVTKQIDRDMQRQKRAEAKLAKAREASDSSLPAGSSPKSIPKVNPDEQLSDVVLAQLNQAVNVNRAAPAPNAANLGGLPLDYGPDLIELIQRVISPDSWDVNGGPSTMQYWRPGMALVVRAPEEVHEEISPLLLQLRKN